MTVRCRQPDNRRVCQRQDRIWWPTHSTCLRAQDRCTRASTDCIAKGTSEAFFSVC